MAKGKSNSAGNEPNGNAPGVEQPTRGDSDEVGRLETIGGPVEPASLPQPGESASTRKPRKDAGVKRGPRKRSASETESAQDLTLILLSTHAMLAALTKVEEIEIGQDEAERLGAAIARVQALYTDKILPEKVLAWGQLIMVAGSIYGPRIVASRLKSKPIKPKGPGPTVLDNSYPIAEA